MKFVESPHHLPQGRLEAVLGLSSDIPFTTLDAPYNQILSTVVNLERALKILGVMFLASLPKLNAHSLEIFLSYNPGTVRLALCHRCTREQIFHYPSLPRLTCQLFPRSQSI